ncbi:MAG: nucleoside triphosphate pyrophosphohydrolase [Armatimonadetes bacterium]|nr:nucleoside triphosphate pyrophosphohydrolase [Armatimonadota bacterium]
MQLSWDALFVALQEAGFSPPFDIGPAGTSRVVDQRLLRVITPPHPVGWWSQLDANRIGAFDGRIRWGEVPGPDELGLIRGVDSLHAGGLHGLAEIVDRLLGPGGCPWDQEQTHESLKRHLLEEAYEVLDAIDSGALEALHEELGDLLLQPIMHAQMEKLAGNWDIESVAQAEADKLVRRHPHVFGDIDVADSDEVLRNWDQLKKQEKGKQDSILAGVPSGMASLLRAFEISKRAARAGFEWPNLDEVFVKLDEELAEVKEAIESGDQSHIQAEVGDLLFTVVNIARWLKVEPEEALRQMLNRFSARFMAMERTAPKPLRELSPSEWDELWEISKKSESPATNLPY